MKKALLFCIVSCVLMYFYLADIGIWLSNYSEREIILDLLIIGACLFVLYKIVDTCMDMKTRVPQPPLSCEDCGHLTTGDCSNCPNEEG